MTSLVRRLLTVGIVLSVFWTAAYSVALAQLRIVTYNTANGSFSGNDPLPRSGMDTVLQAIADEVVNGIAKPIDALIFQEHASPASTTQQFVDLLNGIYGPGTYARSSVLNGPNFSSIHQTLVYNTNSLQLLSQDAFGSPVGGLNQPERQPVRFEMRPVGYDSSADFLIYNSHYKAGSSTNDQNQRTAEAQLIRADADAQGQGKNIIYAGDFNMQSGYQTGYQTLLASGDGQAFDPIDMLGSWNNNFSYRAIHTQNSTDGSSGLSTAGGLDDRFDFQLVSGELIDNEGLSYIPGSYRAFGNNGTSFNQAINNGGNTYPITNAQLDALAYVSDHLPVVADYQLPAIMNAQLASLPPSIPQGSTVNVDVLVENVANVVSALGADELDYSITVTGDLLGSAAGTDFAMGGFNTHPIALDTSQSGARSGVITVSSASQGVLNPLFNLPVNFTVGPGGGPVFGLIAKDDFDSTLNRTAFSQTPAAGAFSSAADGFQEFQTGVSPTIPFALVDDSFSVFTPDQQGTVDGSSNSPGFKSDAWFGVVDVDNADNPSGVATATWSFDISGASGLEVSIDMAAMGDFDAADSFSWTYAIDGQAAQSLFNSSVDEAGSATYELASGTMVTLDDPLLMTNAQNQPIQLTNDLQTLTSLLSGTGDLLTLELTAITNGNGSITPNDEAYAFDNIVIQGFTGADADFDQDGDVDGKDFLTWQRGFGFGTTLAQGDANGDGQVDDLDLAAWQSQFGVPPLNAQQAAAAIPEPSSLLLAIGFLLALPAQPRLARRPQIRRA